MIYSRKLPDISRLTVLDLPSYSRVVDSQLPSCPIERANESEGIRISPLEGTAAAEDLQDSLTRLPMGKLSPLRKSFRFPKAVSL